MTNAATRPLVFAHRGASAHAPQNTLPAFRIAAELGADGIELDVHLSADRYPVVIHDATLNTLTDGSGRVAAHTLAQLKRLDAGGAPIPTLDEVFDAVGTRFQQINIEIKAYGAEWTVADCIARHAMQSHVIVSSFNPFTLRRFRRLLPQVPIGFLFEPNTARYTSPFTLGLTHDAHHPHHSMIEGALMLRIKERGGLVNAWTVNDAARAQTLRDYGVDGLITDAPEVILRALGR